MDTVMVTTGALSTSFSIHPPLRPFHAPQPKTWKNYQSRWMVLSEMKNILKKRCLYTCQYPGKQETQQYRMIEDNVFQLDVRSSRARRRSSCYALPQSDNVTTDSELPTPPNAVKESEVVNELHSDPMRSLDKRDSSNQGRSGFVTFYSAGLVQPDFQESHETHETHETHKAWTSILWILGPVALLSSLVLPPFFLRKIFEVLLEESLVSDFLILFFTETFFYIGVLIFLAVADSVQQTTGVITWNSATQTSLGYKLSLYATMALSVFLPLGAFAIVWPWTGPAAAAALLPYIVGLAVQYGIEQIVQERKSSVWPLIPIVFQVYRLHQLNRATQLVTGLLFSLRGVEATAESLAVNGSLSTLVSVLQLLGMLSLWSLAVYLTHIFSSRSQNGQQSRVLS